jgi:hypothetical protein
MNDATTCFPAVLLKLDPDWGGDKDEWMSPEDAAALARDLNDEQGWGCSADGLHRYELVDADAGTYCSWLNETITLKAANHDAPIVFVEADA